jgi:hypothetical protein
MSSNACLQVGGGGLDDDKTILDESLDLGSRVGVANLGLLSRAMPDFLLADASDACSEEFS